MKGSAFVRKVRKLGKKRRVKVVFRAERGKGSHGTLYYGTRLTVLKDLRKEISPALLTAMLDQLGISREELG